MKNKVTLMDTSPYVALIDDHREWLLGHAGPHAKAWNRNLRYEPEGALAEAAAREVLETHGALVAPNETSAGGGADFICIVGGQSFLAECTSVSIKKATNVTGLPNPPIRGFRHYSPLNEAVLDKIAAKAGQLGDTGEPVLLVVTTLHFDGSALGIREAHAEFLLHGSPSAGPVDEMNPWARRSGFLFLSPQADAVPAPHYRNISAVLLVGLGAREALSLERPRCGLLHPAPDVEFLPEWLPGVRFGRLEDYPASTEVVWVVAT